MERHVWHNLFFVTVCTDRHKHIVHICAGLRRCIQVVHPNLFSAICNAYYCRHWRGGRTTESWNADPSRQEARKSDKRCTDQACLHRFDNGGYTRIQFLRAVSRSLGAHVPCDGMEQSDSDDTDDADDVPTASSNVAASAAVQPPDLCEVCLVEERDARHSLVHCGHQRFCASCAARVEEEGRGCPLCRTPITTVLRLY